MGSIFNRSIDNSFRTPDAQDVEPSGADHDSWGKQERAVRLNLILDAATIVPVIAVAILSGSMLLYADIIDYTKSVLACLLAWNILRRIRAGQTKEYDYGPGKLESLGRVVGSLLFIVGLIVMAGFAFRRILHPVELNAEFTALGVGFQGAGFALNAWLWRRNRALAERTRSPLMDVQWRIARADALSNLAVIVALTLTLALRPLAWVAYIDPVCALAYLFFATGTFVPPLKAGIYDLTDRTLGEDLQLKIVRRLAEHFDGYEALHGVRSRRVGDRIFVEIALGFNPEKTVGEAMDTIERLRKAIEQDIPCCDASIVVKPPQQIRISRVEKTAIQILPLSPTTLSPALELIRSTFQLRADENPEAELEESLWPGRHTESLAKLGISDPRYWVAFNRNRVVGVTGFYFRPDDRQEAVWGGWAVSDSNSRTGLSRGRYLMLRRMIIEAHATGRKYYRLYTSTAPEERQANNLYDRSGLTVYRTETPDPDKPTILYRQAELAHLMALFHRNETSAAQPEAGPEP